MWEIWDLSFDLIRQAWSWKRTLPEALKEAILVQMERGRDEFREGRQKLYALFDLKGSVETS